MWVQTYLKAAFTALLAFTAIGFILVGPLAGFLAAETDFVQSLENESDHPIELPSMTFCQFPGYRDGVYWTAIHKQNPNITELEAFYKSNLSPGDIIDIERIYIGNGGLTKDRFNRVQVTFDEIFVPHKSLGNCAVLSYSSFSHAVELQSDTQILIPFNNIG